MLPEIVFLTLFASAWGASFFNHFTTNDYDENNLSPFPSQVGRRHDWIEVSQTSGRVVEARAGQRVELECEVLAKPPPTAVQWFKGTVPLTKDYQENNMITGVGLGKLLSRYVIECAQPADSGVYTCASIAGGQASVSSPSTLIVHGTEVECPTERSDGEKAKITTWSPLVLENMSNDVILPCHAEGQPRPSIYWVDENKRIVTNDHRRKIMENGDLVINRLTWEDMGGYTCIAENPLGRDTRLTFLYPMLNES